MWNMFLPIQKEKKRILTLCNVAVRTILHCVDEGEPFDWASYLMEGIEFPTYSDTDSEVRKPATHSSGGWYNSHCQRQPVTLVSNNVHPPLQAT